MEALKRPNTSTNSRHKGSNIHIEEIKQYEHKPRKHEKIHNRIIPKPGLTTKQ